MEYLWRELMNTLNMYPCKPVTCSVFGPDPPSCSALWFYSVFLCEVCALPLVGSVFTSVQTLLQTVLQANQVCVTGTERGLGTPH